MPWRQCVFLFGNYQILIQTADISQPFFEERVLDRKNGIDRRVQYVYDAAGNVLKRTLLGADGECLESSTRYDLKDRATHRTNPAGGVTRYLYDRNDRLRKEINPYGYEPESDDGAGVSYTYDSRGNRLRTTNALGEVVQELSYNLRNQPVIQKDTFGNRTELSYELDGKIKDVRRSGNHQRILQQYEYNARRQITGVVDGNQNPISYDVDSWGRITGIGFVDGVKEGYEYTPAGQVSRTIDGNGNAVQYRYNSLGKISERIDQLGFTETFRYDEEGNLSLHIDRDGRQLQRACNVFGQPVYEKASDAEGKHTNISTWHYDSLGRVTRAVCDGKSYEYIYDAYGNLKEKRSNGKRFVSYAHDRAGQITEIRDPEGVRTRYEYDILGRRSRIYNNDGLEVRYGYDALNRIRHIRYGNGVETAYTYDGDGNIRTLETRAGENVLLSFAYRYDGNGNRTAKTGMQAGVTLGGVTSEITAGNNALDISYNYDVRGQLLEERRNGASVCYAYDKAGNRIRKTDAQGEIRYLYNEKNQLVEEESPADRKQFSYDRQGGIIEEKNAAGIRRFSYNSRRQQTRVETETGNVQENRYDAEGLRFELLENGRRTSFVYHDGELLQEEGREEQDTSYHLGAGKVKNEYDYDAFGNAITEKETVSNPYRYAGYYQDSESGLYYLQSRYYNPRTARFLTEDTASGKYTDPLSLNKYTYCHNQPVTGYDPDGHFLHIVAGAAIGAVVSGGISYASQAIKNKSFTKGINWKQVAGSAAEGAIIGGVGAATGGAGLAASAAGTAAKTGAKTVAKTTAKAVAKKVAINVAGNAAGNVANQAISKGVKKISAKEAAVAGATGILDVAGNAAGTALKKAGSKAVCKIAGAAAEGAGAIAAKKAGAKAAQKALGTSAEAGLAGAGKNAVSSQQGLGKKLLDGIDNLKSTGKALLKDEGGFLDLDALAGKKSVSGAVGKTSYGKSSSNCTELVPYYPANNGAVSGTEKKIYLMAGDKIDRFGGKKGKFFSPTGTPMEMRALPYDADLSQYRQFEVVKPFEVEASTIAPAFGNIGLGTQYRSSVSVDVLLKKDIIKQVGGN